jgi:ketosteroid isomerase-like protein
MPPATLLPLLLLLACSPSSPDTTVAFESLVHAERAFASRSVTSGTRTAFLEFFAEDGIVFESGPKNVRAVWEPRPVEGAVLAWGPEIANVSAVGDMGYTSGPYEVRATHETEPAGWGHFVSVWLRDAEGTWRVAADGGVTHGPASLDQDSTVMRVGGDPTHASADVEIDVEAARTVLADIDTEYSRSVANSGIAESIDAFVDESARFYRNGHLPIVGLEAVSSAAAVIGAVWNDWEPHGMIVSSSGDMGCTYGTVQSTAESDVSDPSWPASYYRIWRKSAGSEWRVVVDVLIPFPPSSE